MYLTKRSETPVTIMRKPNVCIRFRHEIFNPVIVNNLFFHIKYEKMRIKAVPMEEYAQPYAGI